MEQLLDVINVKAHEDNTLTLIFENNETRIFDMTPYLNEKPFTKLKSKALFTKAKVDYGTVVWPGNIDIAPETLWEFSRASIVSKKKFLGLDKGKCEQKTHNCQSKTVSYRKSAATPIKQRNKFQQKDGGDS